MTLAPGVVSGCPRHAACATSMKTWWFVRYWRPSHPLHTMESSGEHDDASRRPRGRPHARICRIDRSADGLGSRTRKCPSWRGNRREEPCAYWLHPGGDAEALEGALLEGGGLGERIEDRRAAAGWMVFLVSVARCSSRPRRRCTGSAVGRLLRDGLGLRTSGAPRGLDGRGRTSRGPSPRLRPRPRSATALSGRSSASSSSRQASTTPISP